MGVWVHGRRAGFSTVYALTMVGANGCRLPAGPFFLLPLDLFQIQG